MQAGTPFPSSLTRSLALLVVGLWAAIAGCASPPRISDSDRARIAHVVVKESHSGLAARVDPFLPENAASGAASGTAASILAIIPTLGVSLIGAPVIAHSLARCGAAVSELGAPAARLKKVVDEADRAAFRRALDAELLELLKLRAASAAPGGSAGGPAAAFANTRLLELHKLEVLLTSATPGKTDKAGCRPSISAHASWRVSNPAGGDPLEEGESICRISPLEGSFKDWFDDPKKLSSDVTALLEDLGRHVAKSLLSGRAARC